MIQLVCSSFFSARLTFKIFTNALLLFISELKVTNFAAGSKIYACWKENFYINLSEKESEAAIC